jgi:hypothetical protein
MKMVTKSMETEKFKLGDILYGAVVPIIIGLVIIFFATVLRSYLVTNLPMDSPIPHILTFGFAQMILFGAPLLLGLVWNKWAGGAAGFIMGTFYYLGMAGYSSFTYLTYDMTVNFYADASLLVYIVTGILMGYMGGALNNKSTGIKRMLGAGLTASIVTGLIMFMVNTTLAIDVSRNMALADPLYSFFLTMLPQVILGILIPIVAKVMTWYGLVGYHH